MLLFATSALAGELSRYEAREQHMGQTFTLVLYAESDETAEAAAKAVFDRVTQLDRIMSDYRADSELSRLCETSEPGHAVEVSEDLFAVLSAANDISRKTDGLFDVTVGPVVKLWRQARGKKKLPSPEALQAARKLVGYESIALDAKRRRVELMTPGMQIDLGGIGVGWTLDDVSALLKKRGVTRFLIDASGDILCADPPPGRSHWRIEVQPLTEKGEQKVTLKIANCSVTTSGDAFRFVEIDGVRYSHIVDPRTGLGLTERSSVTVIADTALKADTYTKAVSILGFEKGMEFIEQDPTLAGSFVVLRNGKTERVESKRFRSFVESDEPADRTE
jgi:thiamine biosynthesis lipoprotein